MTRIWAGTAGLTVVVLAVAGALNTPAQAAFPGLNGKIACSTPLGGPGGTSAVNAGVERLEVFTVNPDGTGEVRLTSTLGSTLSSSAPKYTADGKRIAFAQNGQIWTMNADGTNVKQVTASSLGTNTPGSCSPDGSKIVFHTNRDPLPPGSPAGSNANEIYTVNADGSEPTRLTNNLRFDSHPSWSPDGSKIVFRSNLDGDHDVYTIRPDGSELTNLTPDSPAEDSGPDWSPDGKQIAFHTDRDAFGIGRVLNRNLEIYRMNADGSGVKRLTFTDYLGGGDPNLDLTGYDLLPAWSPQGDRIAFHSGRAPDFRNTGEISGSGIPYVAQWDVFTIDAADGSDIRQVTNRPRNDEHCDWQPIPRPAAAPAPAPKAATPGPAPSAAKLATSLTLTARPRRDRKPPFSYTFSGRVGIPGGASAAAVCGGSVGLTVKRGSKTIANATAPVSRTCAYRRKVTVRGRPRGVLRVRAQFGVSAALAASTATTTVRAF